MREAGSPTDDRRAHLLCSLLLGGNRKTAATILSYFSAPAEFTSFIFHLLHTSDRSSVPTS